MVFLFLFFLKNKRRRLRGSQGSQGFRYFFIFNFGDGAFSIRVKSFREMRGIYPTSLTFIIQIVQDDFIAV